MGYAKSNANTFVRAHAYRVFLTSCVGINLGDIPRGLRHPWYVPSVDPSTLGLKTLYELASLKYCYNKFDIAFSVTLGLLLSVNAAKGLSEWTSMRRVLMSAFNALH